jgi:hypothetical protein
MKNDYFTLHNTYNILVFIIFIQTVKAQCVRKVAVHLGYSTWIWLSVSELPLKCAVVVLYSVVKQRLNCNMGKACNCLMQFLLTMVLSIEECVS